MAIFLFYTEKLEWFWVTSTWAENKGASCSWRQLIFLQDPEQMVRNGGNWQIQEQQLGTLLSTWSDGLDDFKTEVILKQEQYREYNRWL